MDPLQQQINDLRTQVLTMEMQNSDLVARIKKVERELADLRNGTKS